MIVSNFPVLVDACVLFPRALRNTLLQAAIRGLFQLYWTDQIIEETHRNLVETGRLSADQAETLVSKLKEVLPASLVVGYEPLIDIMANDEDDRHVLAAAVKVKAEVIVTENDRHFPRAAVEQYDIRIKRADDFLLDLLSLEPRAMAEIIRYQAAFPNFTIDRVLQELTIQAPRFVDNVRRILDATV